MVRILFLCMGNSCRSQMAKGWLRHLAGPPVEAFSAGTEPQTVNPLAVESMKERAVDISGHRSKSVQEFLGQRFDFVITVCDRAQESCPTFPDSSLRHWNVPDPAKAEGTREERLAFFHLIRDQLRERIEAFLREELGSVPREQTRP